MSKPSTKALALAEAINHDCNPSNYALLTEATARLIDQHTTEAVAERDATIARLREALVRARRWGMAHKGFHMFVAGDLADWVDAGMEGPLPEITSPIVKASEALATADAKGGNG